MMIEPIENGMVVGAQAELDQQSLEDERWVKFITNTSLKIMKDGTSGWAVVTESVDDPEKELANIIDLLNTGEQDQASVFARKFTHAYAMTKAVQLASERDFSYE